MHDAWWTEVFYNQPDGTYSTSEVHIHNKIGQYFSFTVFPKATELDDSYKDNGFDIFYLRMIRRFNNTDGSFYYG